MKTAKEVRVYYNRSSHYESFLKDEGWQTPKMLAAGILPYLRSGESLLDVGCGPGLVGKELKNMGWRGQLIGIDIAEKRLQEARRKSCYTACVHANAYQLPFDDKSFDVVLSNAMVGLTGIKSIQEMRRLVKPGGYLALIMGEIKSEKWCRKRFREARSYLRSLSRAKLIKYKDLGNGYANTGYNDEHYLYCLYQCL